MGRWYSLRPWNKSSNPLRAGQPWKPRCSSLRALDVIAGSTVSSDGTVCPRDPSTSGLSLLFAAFPKRAPSFPAVPDKPVPHPVRGLPFLLSKCVSPLGAADGRSLGHVSGPRSVKGGWERGGFLASILERKDPLIRKCFECRQGFQTISSSQKTWHMPAPDGLSILGVSWAQYGGRPRLKVQSFEAEPHVWGTGAVWHRMLGGGAGRWEEPPAKFSGFYSVICNWSREVVTYASPGPQPGPRWVLVTTCWIFVINLLDCIIVAEFSSKRFAGVHSFLSLSGGCVCVCVRVRTHACLCTHVSFPTTGPISNGYFSNDYFSFFFFFLKIFWCRPFFKVFIEFVPILLLFYILVFWPWGIPLTRDQTWSPCFGKWSLNHWTTRVVLANLL